MSAAFRALFGGKQLTPEDKVREWKLQLNGEMRKLDRQINKIKQEEAKVVKAAKAAAKKNETGAVRIMAKEILHSRKAVGRLYKAKTQISSVSMQMQQQLSQMKVAGALQRSGQIMSTMNSLCKVNEIGDVMRQMSSEMTKAGLIAEMMDDTLDAALDEDISEGEAEEEVNKIIDDVLHDKFQGSRVGKDSLPATQQKQQQVMDDGEEEADAQDDALEARLKALRQ